jgi:uncharacterized protein (TIGR03382 family)
LATGAPFTLAAFAPAAPEGVVAGCWLGGVCDWGCGASGNESSGFWLAVLVLEELDWLDWGGLAKTGISLDITNAPANMAIEKYFEDLRPVRFIYALPGF